MIWRILFFTVVQHLLYLMERKVLSNIAKSTVVIDYTMSLRDIVHMRLPGFTNTSLKAKYPVKQ
jgi:hypothetical protein